MFDLNINGIINDNITTGIFLTKTSCINCLIENSGICFLTKNNRPTKATMAMHMLTIKIDLGGYSNLKKRYEMGKNQQ